MTPVLLSQLAAVTSGTLTGEDCSVVSFSTDTRTVVQGDVYFCLRGASFDGHEFAQDAVAKGAVAVVAEKDLQLNVPQLLVSDTRIAFGRLAMLWRQQFVKPLVGVTGSNGKTTVKQLLASIFAEVGEVHFTRANDNNDIGVPQTLLGLRENHDYAVVEMGASDKGEIRWLGELAQPTVSVITNASAAHLAGFGTAQSVAEEKAWIYKSLSADGTAIINADDQYADYWRSVCGDSKVITFGSSGDVKAARNDDGSINLGYNDETVKCNYQLAGQHNVQNAAAAAACAVAAGVSLQATGRGLATAVPVTGRLNFIRLVNGMTAIDDTYNANPASTRAAIDVLSEFDGSRFIALGDLLELGADEVQEHIAIGEYAKVHQVDRLYAYGTLSKNTVEQFGAGGCWFENQDELIQVLLQEVSDGCAVLVKGSRSMKMERVTAALSEKFANSQVVLPQVDSPEASDFQAGVCCQ